MDTLGRRIQLYQGLKTNLPQLLSGELGYCTDTKELYIGTDSGVNQQLQAEQWIIDDLISTEKGASLSANQGRILKEMIDAIGAGGGGGGSVSVIDNLLSNSPFSALSANQGKVLNEKITNHENNTGKDKHLELVDTEPVDLTNTGVVFLRKTKPYKIPTAPIN